MFTRIDNILTSAELERLNRLYDEVGAQSGKATATGRAADTKRNLQLPAQHPAVQEGMRLVVSALQRSELFYLTAFPRRAFPPMFSRYEPGMTYGEHVDNAILMSPAPLRGDVAVTLFLSDPETYDGGELVITDGAEERMVKLPAGSLVAYPPYFVHRVAPVTRGVRHAAITWVESLVRDPERRRLLWQMDRAMNGLHQRHGDSAELRSLNNGWHTLLRMWAET